MSIKRLYLSTSRVRLVATRNQALVPEGKPGAAAKKLWVRDLESSMYLQYRRLHANAA